jgi:hypothetical protein
MYLLLCRRAFRVATDANVALVAGPAALSLLPVSPWAICNSMIIADLLAGCGESGSDALAAIQFKYSIVSNVEW